MVDVVASPVRLWVMEGMVKGGERDGEGWYNCFVVIKS